MATDASSAKRGILPAIVVLLLVPLNGSVAYFHLLPEAVSFIVTSVIGLLIAGAVILGHRAAIHASLLTFLIAVWNCISNIAIWPSLIIPLTLYAGMVVLIPSLRRSVDWLRVGQFDRTLRALMAAAVLVSSAGLVVWFLLWKPDLTQSLKSVPSWNPWLLVFEGIGFALLNAAMEEAIYRGVLMQALDEALGPGMPSVVLQAAAFGLLHIQGIPGGWVGVFMAMAYGLMLGVIRRRSRGIIAPFVTHVFADLAIFAMLVFPVA